MSVRCEAVLVEGAMRLGEDRTPRLVGVGIGRTQSGLSQNWLRERSSLSSPVKGEDSGEGDPAGGRSRPWDGRVLRLSPEPPHPNLLPQGEKELLRQVLYVRPYPETLLERLQIAHVAVVVYYGSAQDPLTSTRAAVTRSLWS